MRLIEWFRWRLQCLRVGHFYERQFNIHGDGIIFTGGKRSVWRCCVCGKWDHRVTLYHQLNHDEY